MEMIKTSAPKTSKITERRQIYTPRKQATCIDKGNTAADPEIRTAVFEYSEKV
jgi:hypothetical protein